MRSKFRLSAAAAGSLRCATGSTQACVANRVFRTIAVLACILVAGCKPAPEGGAAPSVVRAPADSSALQKSLNAAVAAGELETISALLKKGAQPDKAVGSERDALTVAGELCRQHKGSDAVIPPVKVLVLLRKHVRHRDDKVVQAQGKLRVGLMAGNQPGVMYAQLSVTFPDGTSYPAELSSLETTFVNTSMNNRQFAVAFDETYRFHGTVTAGRLELDELELLPGGSEAAGTSAGAAKKGRNGMVIPVQWIFPSSGAVLKRYLE